MSSSILRESDLIERKSHYIPENEVKPQMATSGTSKMSRPSKCVYIILIVLLILILTMTAVIVTLAVTYFQLAQSCSLANNETEKSVSTETEEPYAKGGRRSTKNVRLPFTLVPVFYDLKLQVYLDPADDNAFNYNGSVVISCHCRQATDFFHIHANADLSVDFSNIQFFESATNRSIGISTINYDDQLQWLTIKLDEQLQVDQHYRIVIAQFSSALNRNCKGWYLGHYVENGVKKYLATSQLQSTDARRVFPCWDEPAFKARFKVTLVRNKAYHSLSNMEIENTIHLNNEWYADVFHPTVNMSTYLLAFVVSQFKSLSKIDSRGRNFSVWAKPDGIHAAKYALDTGIKIMSFFEKYFKMDYPLNKIDMIAVPQFAAGAMENWGLMIYREETMLWDPEEGLAANLQKVANVISHEIAHQWFGNLVTLQWWDDLWLNEGFASFVEYIGVQHVHPEWQMDVHFLVEHNQKALHSDAFTNSRPVIQPVHYPDEINEIFDSISYSKGATILRMMEAFLGRDIFRKGVQTYLKQNQFKNTIHDDLWRSLTEVSELAGKPVDIKTVMNTWMKQMNYPLVTVYRISTRLFHFKQSHYYEPRDANPPASPNNQSFQWQIPVTYAGPDTITREEPELFWLKNTSMTIELDVRSDTWYLINIGQHGFYRVHYTDDNWYRLALQLKQNHHVIPPASRTQILTDLCQLGSQGIVSYKVFLDLSTYLVNEEHYVPWLTARQCFLQIDRLIYDKPIKAWFNAHIRGLVDQSFSMVDWRPLKENENYMKILLRDVIVNLACQMEHPRCLDTAKEMYRNIERTNSTSHIPPSIRKTIICTIVQTGGFKEWYHLRERIAYLDKPRFGQNTGREVEHIRTGLGCTQNPWLLKQMLSEQVKHYEDEMTESFENLYPVFKNPLGQKVIWEEIRDFLQTAAAESGNLTDLPWKRTTYSRLMKNLSRRQFVYSGIIRETEIHNILTQLKLQKNSTLQYELSELLKLEQEDRKWMERNLGIIETWLYQHVANPAHLLA